MNKDQLYQMSIHEVFREPLSNWLCISGKSDIRYVVDG